MQPNQPQPIPPLGPNSQPPVPGQEYTTDPLAVLAEEHGPLLPGPGQRHFRHDVKQHENGQYEVVPPISNTGSASGHNPYEFIINPDTTKRRSGPLLGKLSFTKQIGLLVGGVAVLLIVAAVVISALGPKSSLPGLISLAQRQQEIIRIATISADKTSSSTTKNFVINTELAMLSSQTQILTYLGDHGTKLGTKVLALDQDPKTDLLLTNAAAANNYDSAVTQALTSQLNTYLSLLQTTFKQAASPTTKKLLQNDFSAAHDLLDQAKSLSPASS
ncbi:MAG TPA: hypothetical protein VLF69_05600 [Candidatus Saccharimonadales bacterium]|nr:hypothetical protein [Candidatus Saccharimonadales bacterium]